MTPWVLPAPAKLNLLLRITGRRADGYHELQTLFQLLDYGDTLSFTPRDDGVITLGPALTGVELEENLIVRAARLLQRETGCRAGADIVLDKRLPLGGGLGGGSSDAATTLVALDRLWHLDLGHERLAALGLSLGADVPVFVRGDSAWAEGVGERLVPVALAERWFVVIHPGVAVSTAAVFGHPGLTRDSATISMRLALDGATPETVWRNDCESVVRALYPEVDRALAWLSGHADALLTGTGACVFCSFADEASADAVIADAPEGWQIFKARGVARSPLHHALEIATA
ncbi:4-(cytidine 5'-diphospho)-2-C-methyl-D-erythritol kinase [Salinicola endophyticus]|uniref:4-diphosphocytidyl-2-C-methyl-D-erythritol kinase n=1 Tax=Salinicola endophyticus TaxID=1949083 RepID=A0ABY8FIP7_9GAMM|nr:MULTISPECIES: 4-(cytidine 5'-diphospho)-2-C-methyl-D-erythritol kinase [Salinicola]WFF42693.1 4-(cytidine 5'-diphospho)-2-C-methyl-D-erythritol kinase [Salinicola endophyticus]